MYMYNMHRPHDLTQQCIMCMFLGQKENRHLICTRHTPQITDLQNTVTFQPSVCFHSWNTSGSGVRGYSRGSLLLRRVAALRLRARKERVGVMSRSTMRLSHGLRRRLRAGRERGGDQCHQRQWHTHLPTIHWAVCVTLPDLESVSTRHSLR